MKTRLRIRTVSIEVTGDAATISEVLRTLLPAPPPASEEPPKKASREIAEGTPRPAKKPVMSDGLCPNCHQPHHGLVVTAPMGPDGSGVKHCGCFWAGDAEGKDFHHSTTTAEQHAWMRGERSEDEMANGVKGYVVRGKDGTGALQSHRDDGTTTWSDVREDAESLSLREAQRVVVDLGDDIAIFAVAADGTETPLPSYEKALSENERLSEEAKKAAPPPPPPRRPTPRFGQGRPHDQIGRASCRERV